MTVPRHIAVIDIGKTNAKLALVDLARGAEVAVITRPNTVITGPPWAHFDTEGHWAFVLAGLKTFHADHRIDAISVTTHGASVVLLDAQGTLAAPILDYEHPIPADIAAQYDALRPDFAQTGSPRLANGLNVGAQLHYQFTQMPGLRDRVQSIVGYPQYWGHRLTGQLAFDVTSIGCHTDLWDPATGTPSTLVDALGVADKLAPVRRSGELLGTLLPDIATATGLPASTPVAVGIHDSNASLYPHLRAQNPPFAVISTGTWVVTMAVGGLPSDLDPDRDTLMNVNALGDPVASARFMGGREYELIQAGPSITPTPDDITQVLATPLLLLPAVDPQTGPFQGQQMQWVGPEPAIGSGRRAAALSFYLAMMTDTCLSLTGAAGPTIIEGPFAHNTAFKSMLAAATGRPVLHSFAATGTAIGAAMLFNTRRSRAAATLPTTQPPKSGEWATYANQWRALANAGR